MLDIDHFKNINDTYGHPAGDAVLQATAAALKEACTEKETVARVGGEEFAIMVRDVDLDAAVEMAERIRAAIESLEVDIGNDVLTLTTSIGDVTYPSPVKPV